MFVLVYPIGVSLSQQQRIYVERPTFATKVFARLLHSAVADFLAKGTHDEGRVPRISCINPLGRHPTTEVDRGWESLRGVLRGRLSAGSTSSPLPLVVARGDVAPEMLLSSLPPAASRRRRDRQVQRHLAGDRTAACHGESPLASTVSGYLHEYHLRISVSIGASININISISIGIHFLTRSRCCFPRSACCRPPCIPVPSPFFSPRLGSAFLLLYIVRQFCPTCAAN